jgi:hypothetical protein
MGGVAHGVRREAGEHERTAGATQRVDEQLRELRVAVRHEGAAAARAAAAVAAAAARPRQLRDHLAQRKQASVDVACRHHPRESETWTHVLVHPAGVHIVAPSAAAAHALLLGFPVERAGRRRRTGLSHGGSAHAACLLEALAPRQVHEAQLAEAAHAGGRTGPRVSRHLPRAAPLRARRGGQRTSNVQRCKGLRIRNIWGFGRQDRSRGCFATPADFPLHECSPYSHVHARRESLGFVHRSRAIFCRPVPT